MANARIALFGEAISRTRAAVGMTLHRRDGQAVFVAVTVAYLLVYLWGIGHLAAGLGGFVGSVSPSSTTRLRRSYNPKGRSRFAR